MYVCMYVCTCTLRTNVARARTPHTADRSQADDARACADPCSIMSEICIEGSGGTAAERRGDVGVDPYGGAGPAQLSSFLSLWHGPVLEERGP